MSNMMVRAVTGLLYVVALVGCTVASPLSFFFFFALVTALTIWEFARNVNAHSGASMNGFISATAGVYLVAAFAGYNLELIRARDFLPYVAIMVYLLVSELYRKEESPLKNWAYAFASQLYIALPFALLFVIAFRYDAWECSLRYEWIYALAIFIFLWTSDTGAYLCGSMLSRYFPAKLFQRISPNKSWVGSIGGGVLCLAVAAVLWRFFPEKLLLWQWMGLGLTVCVFGTWGDLVESLFKRELGIKDSGKLLPGHGGMLDRFDSALLAIPAAVVYFYAIEIM